MQKWLGTIVVLYITSLYSILMWILVTVIEKINVLLINTVLGQNSIFPNDMVFLKKLELLNAKMA